MIKYIIGFVALFFYHEVYSAELVGYSRVIDGDSLQINSYKIRLEGIDAPEMKQKCMKDKRKYFCGKTAKNKLKEKINNMTVRCFSSSKDKYKRYLATCFSKKINLNKWMVKNGYAVAYKRYSTMYVEDENFAKNNNLGLWSGTFIDPEKWRKLN